MIFSEQSLYRICWWFFGFIRYVKCIFVSIMCLWWLWYILQLTAFPSLTLSWISIIYIFIFLIFGIISFACQSRNIFVNFLLPQFNPLNPFRLFPCCRHFCSYSFISFIIIVRPEHHIKEVHIFFFERICLWLVFFWCPHIKRICMVWKWFSKP